MTLLAATAKLALFEDVAELYYFSYLSHHAEYVLLRVLEKTCKPIKPQNGLNLFWFSDN